LGLLAELQLDELAARLEEALEGLVADGDVGIGAAQAVEDGRDVPAGAHAACLGGALLVATRNGELDEFHGGCSEAQEGTEASLGCPVPEGEMRPLGPPGAPPRAPRPTGGRAADRARAVRATGGLAPRNRAKAVSPPAPRRNRPP